jgi:hypothetical protein
VEQEHRFASTAEVESALIDRPYPQTPQRNGSKRIVLPVTLAAEPSSATEPEAAHPPVQSGSIHIELPGRALVSVEAGAGTALERAVMENLLR